MAHSDFERIAAFYHKNNMQQIPEKASAFILNTDKCSAGICLIQKNGIIIERGSFIPGAALSVSDLWSSALKEQYQLSDEEAIKLLNSEVTSSSLWNYYSSGRNIDSTVLGDSGIETITVSMLDTAFEAARTALREALDKGVELVQSQGINERDLIIIAVGELSENAAVQWMLRAQFAFDPVATLISDKRFVDTSGWGILDTVLSEGDVIFKSQESTTISVSLQLYSNTSGESKLQLLSPGQKKLNEDEAQYSPPIYVSGTDKVLRFRTSDGAFNEEVPDSLLNNGEGLIEVACIQLSDHPVFLFRSADDHDNVIRIRPMPFNNQTLI